MNIVNVGYDSTNYYVLADTKPRLLVDAGWPGTMPKFQHACKRLGVAIPDIKHIFVTHFHPDHAGLAHELIRGEARLLVMENQIAFIEPFAQYFKPEHHYTGIDATQCLVLSFDASRRFLATIGIQGQIVATPGHSDDSATLVLDDGSAFTGDLPHPLMADETAQRSWDKLRNLGAKTIYGGHAPPFPMPPGS